MIYHPRRRRRNRERRREEKGGKRGEENPSGNWGWGFKRSEVGLYLYGFRFRDGWIYTKPCNCIQNCRPSPPRVKILTGCNTGRTPESTDDPNCARPSKKSAASLRYPGDVQVARRTLERGTSVVVICWRSKIVFECEQSDHGCMDWEMGNCGEHHAQLALRLRKSQDCERF